LRACVLRVLNALRRYIPLDLSRAPAMNAADNK
jgi:hypothetical protein